MDVITQLWPTLFSGLIVPVVAWLKNKYLADVPVSAFIVQAVLAVALGFLLKAIFAPAATQNELLMFILGNIAVSSGVHAIKKTPSKLRGRIR